MTAIRNYLNKKGQGIVEYAVLLAFIVGLAAALQGVGLKDAVVGVFDDVTAVLAGGEEFDLNSEEGRNKAIAADYANLKKIGEKIKETFYINGQEQANGRYHLPGEFSVVVLPDGTADVLINDMQGFFNSEEWGRNRGSYWLSDLNSLQGLNQAQENERTNLLNLAKSELGIDYTSGTGKIDTSGLYKLNSAGVDESAVKNGSAVSYVSGSTGKVVYTGITAEVTKDNYKSTLSNRDLVTTTADVNYGYRTDRVVKIDIE